MTPFQEKIHNKILCLDRDAMTAEERAVMSQIIQAYSAGRPITQLEIARSERWIGCHPTHEADIRVGKIDTTCRMIREIIRTLRVKYNVPIVSSRKGYTFPTTQDEATEYIEKLEGEIKARNRASFETYEAMKSALDVSNNFFEAQRQFMSVEKAEKVV